MKPFTAALVATYRRPEPLARLLRALADSRPAPDALVVADNAADPAIRDLLRTLRPHASWLPLEGNPGPGAGWHAAMRAALERHPETTHCLLLDDDVVPPPDALPSMLEAAAAREAHLIAPLLCDEKGDLWGFPEPATRPWQRAIRRAKTPADCLDAFGPAPHPLLWCTGACVLVSRDGILRHGYHRADFRFLGEDLEYSMRYAAGGRAFFLPAVHVPHLPPAAPSAEQARRGDLLKFCALLQNLAYLSFRVPHGRAMRRYLPGNFKRFIGSHGPGRLPLAAYCFWAGAVDGQPAGGPTGERIRAAAGG